MSKRGWEGWGWLGAHECKAIKLHSGLPVCLCLQASAVQFPVHGPGCLGCTAAQGF